MALTLEDMQAAVDALNAGRQPDNQNASFLGDIGTDIKRGTQAIPGIATGILDIVPGAIANATPFSDVTDYIGEATGFQPGRFAEEARQEYTPERQAADERVAQAEGFLDKFTTTLAEPRALAGVVAETLPQMVAGGAIGKGLQATGAIAKGTYAVGAGEGAVSAGGAMEGLVDQGADPRTAAIAAAVTGAVVGAVGAGGATLAQKMKIADPDLVVAGLAGSARTASAIPQRGAAAVQARTLQGADLGLQQAPRLDDFARIGPEQAQRVVTPQASRLAKAGELGKRIGLGALQEGVFEEAPQSALESVIANIALGKPTFEGVGEDVATGLLAGSVMGGAFNIRGQRKENKVAFGEAPPLRADVEAEARAAGLNLDSLSGQSQLFKLLNTPGDPKANVAAAKQLATEGFVALTEDLIATKGSGVGPAATTRLREMLTSEALNNKDGVDQAVKGMRGDVQRKIKATDHYQLLPQTAEEAAAIPTAAEVPRETPEAAPAEPAAATTPRPELTPEQKEATARVLKDLNMTEADLDAITDEEAEMALTGVRESRPLTEQEIEDAPVHPDYAKPEPDKLTNKEKLQRKVAEVKAAEPVANKNLLPKTPDKNHRATKGIADLIDGISESAEATSLAKQKAIATKGTKDAMKALKKALPQFYTKTGSPRATVPADLKHYLKTLDKNLQTAHDANDGRIAEAVRRRGENLAKQYNTDALRLHVNSLVYGHKLLRKARPVGPVTQAVRTMLRDIGTTDNPEAAGYLKSLFDTFHEVSLAYEQKSAAVGKETDPEFSADFRPDIGEGARNREVLGVETDILGTGKGTVGVRNLQELGSDLTELLGLMEEVVPREHLNMAQFVSKRRVFQTQKDLPANRKKQNSQPKAALRFSRYYKQYQDEGVIDPSIGTSLIRKPTELTALDNKTLGTLEDAGTITYTVGQPNPDMAGRHISQLEKNMQTQREHMKEGGDTVAPVILLLDSLSQHSSNAVTVVVANRLKTVLSANNYADLITVNLHPEQTSDKGAVGSFIPAATKQGGAELNLWTAGHTEATIIHELMHAVTVGQVSAYYKNKLKGTAKQAMDDMAMLYQTVLDMMGKEIEKNGTLGSPVLDARYATLSSKVVGLDEFITYSMVDRELQGWMKARRGPTVNKFTAKNLWAVFSGKLRVLLNLNRVETEVVNNLLDGYTEAVGAVLAEAEAAGSQSLNAFFFIPREGMVGRTKKPRKQDKGKSVAEFNAIADPSKPWPGKYSGEAAAGAHERRIEAYNKLRAKSVKEQKAAEAMDIAIIGALNDERYEQAIAAELASKERTATTPREGAKGPHDANYIDAVERQTADAVVRFLSGEKYATYAEFSEDMLNRAGDKVLELSAREEYIFQVLGRVLSKVVDKFGVPEGYRNMMGSFEHSFRGKFNDAWTAYENLLTLTADEQQAMLNYIANGDETQLRANLPNEPGKRQADTVVETVKALEALLHKAKLLGIVEHKNRDKALIDFIDLSEGAFKVVNKTSYGQITPASGPDNIVRFDMPVPRTSVYDKAGKPTEDVAGKEYNYGVDPETNEPFFIETGADIAAWDALGIAPPAGKPELNYPFRVVNPNATGGAEYRFERRVSIKERHDRARQQVGETVFKQSDKARAHTMSALTRLTQDWNRTIEGRQIIDNMVSINENMKEPDRWISTEKPTDVKDSRIVQVGKDSTLAKSRGLRSKLRVPGNWAKIEDNKENRKVFGAMAGKYVAGPVYSSVLDYNDTTPVINSQVHRAALVMWKKGKTVFSPVAHVNNVMGNITLAYYYDLPYENLKRARKIVLWGLRSDKWRAANPLSAADEALRKEMHDEGITLAQAKTADFDIAAEMRLGDFVHDKLAPLRSVSEWFTKVEDSMATAGEYAADLYSNQDNVFRLATYMTYIQDNADIGAGGKVNEAVKKAAARRAESAFVDYRIHAPWIKAARETAFPFVAWPYRMFPLLMKVMITKPWKAANTMMAIYAINAVSYAILGADGHEEDEERNLMPEWYQNGLSWMPWVPSSIRLPFGSGENAYFLNLSRTIPLADMDSVGGNGVPSLITPGGPAFILAYALNGFDPFTGKELSNGTEDTMGFLESRAEYLARAMAPGILTGPVKAYNRQQETGPLGYDRNLWVDLGKVLGVSSFQVNKPEAAFYKDIARQQAEREVKSQIARVWRNELRQKDPDYEGGVQEEIRLQELLIERLQELAGET